MMMLSVRFCATDAVSEGGLRGGQAGRQHERARGGLHGAANLSTGLIAVLSFQLLLLHLRQDLQDTLQTFWCSTLSLRVELSAQNADYAPHNEPCDMTLVRKQQQQVGGGMSCGLAPSASGHAAELEPCDLALLLTAESSAQMTSEQRIADWHPGEPGLRGLASL